MVKNSEIKIFAPAKVNLYLHVTGKKANGYHTLESLVCFGDFGDEIIITPSVGFSFEAEGEFAPFLSDFDDNLVVRAVKILSDYAGKTPNLSIKLIKNIPIGAGLGGGSADAAAVFRALTKYWELYISPADLRGMMKGLGADIPVCYAAQSCIMRGIGEQITPIQIPRKIPAILVYPNVFNPTENIFKEYSEEFTDARTDFPELKEKEDFYNFLRHQRNDLTKAALSHTPETQEMLDVVKQQYENVISRISGSGSACVGVFPNAESSKRATDSIRMEYPEWWVKEVVLN